MKVLITGRSGSGKSTLYSELSSRGMPAFDTDRLPGLAQWVNARTGKPTTVDYDKPIDRATTHWDWSEKVLTKLLAQHDDVLLCGSADNDLSFHSLFDKIFVLSLSRETQRQRILSRTEHDYGKLPEMQELILAVQEAFVRDALAIGAIKVDAEREPGVIVDDILRSLS